MNIPRLAIIGVFVALIFLGICETAAHAASPAAVHSHLPPVGPYPDAECNYDSSGDVYIGPDNDFWECICERRTFVDDDCGWYNQGPVTRKLSRRLRARYHFRTVPRMRVLVLS